MHVLYDEDSVPSIAAIAYPRLCELVAEATQTEIDYEVDVSFLDEVGIRAINRDYRGKDSVTDVISFAFLDDKDETHRINEFEGDMMLGTILICEERAKAQAAEIGQSADRELCFLFVHGLLHLLGYDHIEKEDEETMFGLQRQVMDRYEETYGKL